MITRISVAEPKAKAKLKTANINTNNLVLSQHKPVDKVAFANRKSINVNIKKAIEILHHNGGEMRVPPFFANSELRDSIKFEKHGFWGNAINTLLGRQPDLILTEQKYIAFGQPKVKTIQTKFSLSKHPNTQISYELHSATKQTFVDGEKTKKETLQKEKFTDAAISLELAFERILRKLKKEPF